MNAPAAVPLPHGDLGFTSISLPFGRIRRLRPEDAVAFSGYRSDPDVAKRQEWDTPFPIDRAVRFIADLAGETPGRPGSWFQFAVANAADDLIGDVALFRELEDPGLIRIGYTIATPHQGHGYATAATGAILEYAFTVLGAHTARAGLLDGNTASIRVLEKLGFEPDGPGPDTEVIDGVIERELVWVRRWPQRPTDAVGAILVGGRSTRMGEDKTGVEIAGVRMFDRVHSALLAAGLDVVAVGDKTPGTVPTIGDRAGIAGPAAGLAAALDHAAGRDVFLVATDQPYLDPVTVRRLLAIPGVAVAAMDGGRAQSTAAVYRPVMATALDTLLAADPAPSLQPLLDSGTRVGESVWRAWGEDGRSWRSLDTPESIEHAVAELGPPLPW